MRISAEPLISVAMGICYRRQDLHFLKRSVESILNQSFCNFELLICENDSSKEAKEVLSALVKNDQRVRLIEGKGAATLAEKLNRCIDSARGTYIARMDDDDISDPVRFEEQLAYLEAHPEIAFVGSVAKLEQDGEVIGMRRLPEVPQMRDFLFTQPFLHPTLMFRKSVFGNGWRYCEEKRCAGCEDYDLLFRLYERGLIGANLQDACFTYTLPPHGTTNRTWQMRWNEVQTRWVRFGSAGLLPQAILYVVKPLAVGLLPKQLLQKAKEKMQWQI